MNRINGIIWALFISTLLTSCQQSNSTTDQDWSQYKYDNYRSGISPTQLDLSSFDEEWQYTASHAPVPAWYGPANEDAFANSGPLPSMRDYDLAYYPIIVGDKLFFGSTADDAIHCLDVKTGEEIWRFTTNGPIHNAPVYENGRLYFGSDDGHVYCINAKNAKLIWSYTPSPEGSRLVLNNGRLISFWPIRTGVTIENDRVYFGASLLPWKKSYFCAIDKATGKPKGKGCYIREYENMTFEGALASTGDKLIQPQGRIAPAFFDKGTGESAGSLPGAGGCFVLVTKEEHIIHSKTSRNKTLQELSQQDQPDFMSFNGGKEIVVKGDTSYVLTDHSISAYQRSTQKLIWLRRDFHAHRIIIAGDYLIAGATDWVYAISLANGLPLWKSKVKGTVYALAAAGEALYASTGEGVLYCFRSGGKSNPLLPENLNKPATIDPVTEENPIAPAFELLDLFAGPFIEPISEETVKVSFQTHEPVSCTLTWLSPGNEDIIRESESDQHHTFELPVRKDFRYSGMITGANSGSLSFEYDNFFNYKKSKGLCLILGIEDQMIPNLQTEFSGYEVVVLDPSKRRISKLRNELTNKQLYGHPISAYPSSELSLSQISPNLASLVWVKNHRNYTPDEIITLIAPRGKAILTGLEDGSNWLSNATLTWQIEAEQVNGNFVLTKLDIEDQGEWTHQYARPDNSAFGGESLWGSTSTAEFEVQWMGRPGPRFQTDRSGRKPSPLSVSGKLFVQGKERVLALNVYNGAICWSKDFPGFIRMNIHRDCSNWAADNTSLYMVVGDNLLVSDQMTGELKQIIPVSQDEGYDWGFIAVLEEQIIGSTTLKGSHYTDYHGGAGWYDWAEGPMAEKVISMFLFARSKMDGDERWNYSPQGAIINSTITIHSNRISFVESRTPNLKPSDAYRGQDDLFDRIYLVSLDLDTGEKILERKLDQHAGKTMYSMAAGNGRIVILSSADSEYHLYTYRESDGELIWTDTFPWFNSNHGGHLSRPAIIANRLIVKPAMYALDSGERIDYNVPKSGHGCASYALTEQSIFYRGGSVTQFNFDTHEFSRWERLRPDCWISTIPAQGMILSPEAGGGCSCGNWLETSMVMSPVSRAPITIERAGEEHLLDFKDETYNEYHLQYLPNEFSETISVEINVKPNTKADIYYTLDGSEPSMNSPKYTGPLNIDQSAEVKALVIVASEKGNKQYFRSKKFTKVIPIGE